MELLFAILSTFNIIFGSIFFSFIIFYLKQKPTATKNAFDLVSIDLIFAAFLFSLTLYVIVLIYVFFGPIPLIFSSIFVCIQLLLSHFFLVSFFFTMLLKYLFIFHEYLLFEYSDTKIRIIFLVMKLCSVLVFAILDNFGPLQINPIPFQIIAKENESR